MKRIVLKISKSRKRNKDEKVTKNINKNTINIVEQYA